MYFKKWVQNIISFIWGVSFALLPSCDIDHNSLTSIIIVVSIFAATSYLLVKYGKFEEEE